MASKGTTLGTNDFLAVGDYIQSPSGEYMAAMQGDGNFVLYKGGNQPVWASNSVHGAGPAPKVVLYRRDGDDITMRAIFDAVAAGSISPWICRIGSGSS